jgi:hypothetical protein
MRDYITLGPTPVDEPWLICKRDRLLSEPQPLFPVVVQQDILQQGAGRVLESAGQQPAPAVKLKLADRDSVPIFQLCEAQLFA